MKKFIIDASANYIRTAMTDKGELIELVIEDKSGEPRAGDIFAARVKNIVKNQYAFVDIGAEKNGFMHLKGQNIQQGQALVVQVEKPAYGEKGCALSSDLSLSGRFAAVTTDSRPIGVSRKITDDAERERLAGIARNALPEGFSCVVRTNAANAGEDVLTAEITALSAQLKSIITQGGFAKPPYCLFRCMDDTQRLLRDCIDAGDEVIVNDAAYFDILKQSYPNAVFYDKKIPLFEEYGIESRIDKLLARKVWLDCGGFLVFDYTEAMTVIDVNTGKFTDGKNMRKTALKTNIQAAKEIAYQLRLRNLSGIIIVDFVNMQHEEDILQLESALKEAVLHDRVKTVYVGMTALGLAQLTRQKQSLPLHTVLKSTCKACRGSGEVPNERYLCDKIKNRAESILAQTIYKKLVVKGSLALITMLKKYAVLDALAVKYNASIDLVVTETGAADHFEIEKGAAALSLT